MKIDKGQKARVYNAAVNEKRKNTVSANLSTYEGKDKDDNAVYSLWRTNFVGAAFEKAKMLSSKDEIILTDAKIENSYNKQNEKSYVYLTVFDFDKADVQK